MEDSLTTAQKDKMRMQKRLSQVSTATGGLDSPRDFDIEIDEFPPLEKKHSIVSRMTRMFTSDDLAASVSEKRSVAAVEKQARENIRKLRADFENQRFDLLKRVGQYQTMIHELDKKVAKYEAGGARRDKDEEKEEFQTSLPEHPMVFILPEVTTSVKVPLDDFRDYQSILLHVALPSQKMRVFQKDGVSCGVCVLPL